MLKGEVVDSREVVSHRREDERSLRMLFELCVEEEIAVDMIDIVLARIAAAVMESSWLDKDPIESFRPSSKSSFCGRGEFRSKKLGIRERAPILFVHSSILQRASPQQPRLLNLVFLDCLEEV